MHGRKLTLIAFGLGIVAAPVCYGLIGSLLKPAIAQDRFSRDPEAAEIRAVETDTDDFPNPRTGQVNISPAGDVHNPVDIYVGLAKQKAQLLMPAELANATEALKQELIDLQATRKLREAEQQLQQIIDEHPGSAAANRARMMLDSGRGGIERRNTFDSNDSEAFNPPRSRNRRNVESTFESDQEHTVPARRRQPLREENIEELR